MITYAQLLRQRSVTCSYCGRQQFPLPATCYTGPGDVVTRVLCRQCESVCDRLHNRLGQVECPITPCKDPDGKAEAGVDSGGDHAG